MNGFINKKLALGENPEKIINDFFLTHTNIKKKADKHNFLFKVIQYTERQVVLIDAIEDAFFSKINNVKGNGSIDSVFNKITDKELTLNQISNEINKFASRIVYFI